MCATSSRAITQNANALTKVLSTGAMTPLVMISSRSPGVAGTEYGTTGEPDVTHLRVRADSVISKPETLPYLCRTHAKTHISILRSHAHVNERAVNMPTYWCQLLSRHSCSPFTASYQWKRAGATHKGGIGPWAVRGRISCVGVEWLRSGSNPMLLSVRTHTGDQL